MMVSGLDWDDPSIQKDDPGTYGTGKHARRWVASVTSFTSIFCIYYFLVAKNLVDIVNGKAYD